MNSWIPSSPREDTGPARQAALVALVALGHAAVVLSLLDVVQQPVPQQKSALALRVSWIEVAPAAAAVEPPSRPLLHPLPDVRSKPLTPRQPAEPGREPAPVATAALADGAGAETAVTPAPTFAAPATEQASPVTPPRFEADYLSNPPPAYPRAARDLGEQGLVVLRVRVSVQGLAEEIHVQTSSRYPRLDQAALAAVARWRFVPVRQGAEAVAAWVLVPVSFTLRS
jgi:protein TonB